MHYSIVNLSCSNFNVITAFFSGVREILGFLQYAFYLNFHGDTSYGKEITVSVKFNAVKNKTTRNENFRKFIFYTNGFQFISILIHV